MSLMKTKVVDISEGSNHLRECAEEMGVDYLEYRSHVKTIKRERRTIEIWYNEDSNTPYAWKAFIMGIGTSTGLNPENAINNALKRVNEKKKT